MVPPIRMKRTKAKVLVWLVVQFNLNILIVTGFLSSRPLSIRIRQNDDGALQVRRHTRQLSYSLDPKIKVPPDIQSLINSLEAVQSLPRIRNETADEDYNGLAKVDPATKPTFRRLFTHDTWKIHVGGTTHRRWMRCMKTIPNSVILRAVSKTVFFLSIWAAFVSYSIPKLLSGTVLMDMFKEQSLPLSLCGNAIGLLLVFRTNHAYRRLEEARDLMENVKHLCGEITSVLVSAWRPDSKEASGEEEANGVNGNTDLSSRSVRTSTVAAVCRHLSAFSWSLRDELRDGDERDDVLRLLLPEKEATWVSRQRSRALAIHGNLRRILYEERCSGRLSDTYHFIQEGHLKELSAVVASCERLFTSPIPPTMSRHGLRSMTMWMMALPIVFSFSIPPIVNVAWTCAIAFVYLGIDELGVQVEQPFRVIPMWQLCQLVQEDILELTLHPLDL